MRIIQLEPTFLARSRVPASAAHWRVGRTNSSVWQITWADRKIRKCLEHALVKRDQWTSHLGCQFNKE